MEEKTYSQMYQEFVKFYYNDVKDRLPEYTKMRRAEGAMQIAFFATFCSFSLIFAFVIWFQFISEFLFKIFPSFVNINPLMKILCGVDIVVCIVSIISLILLSVTTSNSKNTLGNTRYIQQDLEMELKQDLMPKFVDIFFDNGVWYKKSLYNYQHREITKARDIGEISKYNNMLIEESKKDKQFHIKNLRSQKLLNPYPWERYDDIIWGEFKNVNIKMYELNTKILRFPEIVVIAFLFIWLCGFTGGIFFFIFLYFILPNLFLAILILSFKIIQYSPFRGVIIEFDMNKKFLGHTIIHEKSLTAKKIPLSKNYQDVKLEASDFSNKYNVYSDNQIEARYLLTPSMMERIENLRFTFKANYVRCSFKDNKLIIAIHTGKDMFAMGNDFKDSDTNTFKELYDEMVSVLKIVDELKLNQHIGL